MPQPPKYSAKHEKQLKRFEDIKRLSLILFPCLFLVLGYLLLSRPELRNLERRVTWPVLFQLRDALGHTADLDPRLRVITFDDSDREMFKGAPLASSSWTRFLSFLDEQRPASIYVGGDFGWSVDDLSSLYNELPILANLKSRIALAVLTSTTPNQKSSQLDLTSSQFQARNFISDMNTDLSEDEVERLLTRSGFQERPAELSQGPIKELRTLFNLGHFDRHEDNQIFPLYRTGRLQVLPSLALSGRINLKIEMDGLTALGRRVPLNAQGAVLVNWLPPAKLKSQTISLASVFESMNTGIPSELFPENAHIFVMPTTHNERANMTVSPFGKISNGMTHVMTLNSALTNSWISDFNQPIMLLCFVLLNLIISWFLQFRPISLILGTQVVLCFVIGIFSFVFFSADTPWLTSSILLAGSGSTSLWLKTFWLRKKKELIGNLNSEQEKIIEEKKRRHHEEADNARITSLLKTDVLPEWPDIQISSYNKGMSPQSGDWYFFESSPSGRYGHFVMCDIVGDGVQAALVVNSCRTILSILKLEKNSLFESVSFVSEYTKRLNAILHQQGKGQLSASLVGITFDFHNEDIHYLSCASPYPIYHSTEHRKKWLNLKGKLSDPIGYSQEIELEMNHRKIDFGDVIIVHTNGIALNRTRRILGRYFEEMDSGILIPAKRLFEASKKELLKLKLESRTDDACLVVFRKHK